MKLNEIVKTPCYIALFGIIFLFILIKYYILSSSTGLIDIEFKSISIALNDFPFGILKENLTNGNFSSFYYFLISPLALFKNELTIKIFNSFISILNILIFFKIGKNLLNWKLGLLLSGFLALNHFFLYYSNLIAPYCINFLVISLVLNSLIIFLKKPNEKTFKTLNIFNILLIFVDNLGFVGVLGELIILNKVFEKKIKFKNYLQKLNNSAGFAFILVFIFLFIQFVSNSKNLIPDMTLDVGINFSSFYLLINEFISPYLSFQSPEILEKSTLGMIYTYFLNPDLSNLNSIKLFLTLFYSSILPVFLLTFFSIKSAFKDYKLRILFYISILNFIMMSFFIIYGFIGLNPTFFILNFLIGIILLCYGIFQIKDIFFKFLIIFCLIIIQFINPDVNSFKVTIHRKSEVNGALNIFLKEYKIKKNDCIIMPYLGHYAKKYYKKYSFFDFDYSMLQKNQKDGFVKNLISTNAKTINKNNFKELMTPFLTSQGIDEYFLQYFSENINNDNYKDGDIVLFIDKLNSRPLNSNGINKVVNLPLDNQKLRKINFYDADLLNNETQNFYSAIETKSLDNIIRLLNSNFYLRDIVEYKKIDTEIYKLKKQSKSLQKAITSYSSDWVFIIYRRI